MDDFDFSSWFGNIKLIFLNRLLFPKDTLPLDSLRRDVGLDWRTSSSPKTQGSKMIMTMTKFQLVLLATGPSYKIQ